MAKRRSTSQSLSETYLAKLCAVVASPDPAARVRLVAQMETAGIPREQVCDVYIPEAARRMGEQWCEDTMSFAEVSIRSARLQSMLRDLALGDEDKTERGGASLMVVSFETHTLGAMVLTGRLRRIGASVRLMLGGAEAELERAVADADFDGIFLSVSLSDDLAAVNRVVRGLRAAKRGAAPVIVGGGLLDNGTEAALRLTGADHVTNDLACALELCGYVAERAERP